MKTNVWFLVERAEDLPDAWVAHCLELDVITWGSSPEDALRMGCEAAQMTLADDIARGYDSRKRRAPEEDWQKLYTLMAAPKKLIPVSLLNNSQEELRIIGANLELSVPSSGQQTEAPPVLNATPVGGILAA